MMTSFKALPTSKREIADYARRIRRRMQLEQKPFFPIVEFLEMTLQSAYEDMTLDIVPVDEMPFKEGETLPGQNTIRIREDVYYAACNGDGRARFTIAHEIGHFMLHTPDAIVLCRMEVGQKLKPYEDPEWQANTFASELLMPPYLIVGMTKRDVMREFGVSEKAAMVALKKCAKA